MAPYRPSSLNISLNILRFEPFPFFKAWFTLGPSYALIFPFVMVFCNPLLKPGLLNISNFLSDFEVRHKKRFKHEHFFKTNRKSLRSLKVSEAQAYSLIAMASSPLAWVGEIPYVSTNGGEKGDRLA